MQYLRPGPLLHAPLAPGCRAPAVLEVPSLCCRRWRSEAPRAPPRRASSHGDAYDTFTFCVTFCSRTFTTVLRRRRRSTSTSKFSTKLLGSRDPAAPFPALVLRCKRQLDGGGGGTRRHQDSGSKPTAAVISERLGATSRRQQLGGVGG